MKRKRLLVIDDEVDFCLLLKAYFSSRNYEVFLANSLKDGLKTIDQVTPDIVFLDNNLPDGLGWEMAPSILNKHPNIELNLISAYQNHQSPSNAALVRIWEKPVNLADLNSYISQVQ